MFSALGDILQLLANLDSCDLRKPYHDLTKFCWPEVTADGSEEPKEKDPDVPDFDDIDDESTKEKCAMSTVLENFSKNAFVLMGKGSSMA